MITGATTPGYDDCWFEYEMVIHFNPFKQYPFPKELENRIDYNTFNQIIRTINDITDNIGLDVKQKWNYKWRFVSLINCLFVLFGWAPALVLTLSIILNGSKWKYIPTIIVDSVWCFCLTTFCCICFKKHSIQNQRKFLQGIELQSRLQIMNEITKDKMFLSYQNRKLIFQIKTDRVEIPNNLLYVSDAENCKQKQNYDGYNPLLPDDMNENNYVNAEECKPMIRYEMEVSFDPKHEYKFPKKFEDRMDENVFSQITKTLHDIAENVGLGLRQQTDKYLKYMYWASYACKISLVLMLPCVPIGSSNDKLVFVLFIGLGFLFLGVVSFVCVWWAARKSNKYYAARRILCVNALNDRIQIMNKRMKNQLMFTYFKGKLIIEVKVDYLEVKNDLLTIIGTNNGLNEQNNIINTGNSVLNEPLLSNEKQKIVVNNKFNVNYSSIEGAPDASNNS